MDLKKALETVESEGSRASRRFGSRSCSSRRNSPPTKADLVGSGKIKVTGTGGGTTYIYTG